MCGDVSRQRFRHRFRDLPYYHPFYPDVTHEKDARLSPVLPSWKRWKAGQLAHDSSHSAAGQSPRDKINTLSFFFCSVSLTRPTSCGTTSLRRGSSPSRSQEGRTLPTPTSTRSIPRSNITSMEWHSQVGAPKLQWLLSWVSW